MRDIFVLLVVFGTLPFIFKRPYIGILLWCWLGYMNPHKLSWSFAHDFPFAQITALTILMSLLISKDEKKIPHTRETVILMVFIGWMLITTLFSMYPDLAWQQWDKVWKIQLMTFVTIIIMNKKEYVHWMVWIIALSLGFYGFKGGIFTIMTGGGYAVYGPSGTFIYGNNEIGLALIMTIPLIRYLQLNTASFWIKRGLMATMLLCIVSIIGTQSRGALVGLCAMGLVFVFKSRNKASLLMTLMVVLTLTISFMPDTWHSRMSTIGDEQVDTSVQGRFNAWWMAFNLAKSQILGGGFESFQQTSFWLYAPEPGRVHDAHSIYFEVLGEHGFIGLTLFLLLGLFSLKSCSTIIKQTKNIADLKWMRDLAAMLQVSMIGYAASGAFLGLAYFDFYYNLVAIVVICRKLLSDALAEQKETIDQGSLFKMNPPGLGRKTAQRNKLPP